MRVKVRLGAGLARLAEAPLLTLDLPDGATVAQLRETLALQQPELAPALASALPVRGGSHVTAAGVLADGDEVALLIPVSGG